MKRRLFLATLLAAGLIALGACGANSGPTSEDGDLESEREEAAEQTERDSDVDPEPERDAADPDDPRPIGSSCAGDAACASGYCLNDERLVQLMPSGIFVSMPHGLCTLLDCNAEQPDARCLDNESEHCVSFYALSGDSSSVAVGVCLQTCQTAKDCLLVDAPLCFDPEEWVRDGLLSEGDSLRYFAGRKVCLPESFKNALQTISQNAKKGG